jgi:hypothetical protein
MNQRKEEYMATVTRIFCQILTANVARAGTDGAVYLGIGGREFRLDTNLDDFERGSGFEFILGDGGNINYAADNDPRRGYVVDTADLDHFPVYIRFQPVNNNDHWRPLSVIALAFEGTEPFHFVAAYASMRLNVPGGQWLGYLNGHVLHLNKIFDEPRALAALEEGRRLHASHGNPNKSISLSDPGKLK